MVYRLLLLIFIFYYQVFSSQKVNLEINFKVIYDSKLKLGEKFQKNQRFILIGNSFDYYFAAEQNFLNDTKQYEPKGIDVQSISDYFQERLIKLGANYHIFFSYIDAKIQYSEKQSIKWVLYNEEKIIAGVKCQMAATNLFGRRWIAYFAKNGYDFSVGPYKFSGLPGLIFEIYDTRDDYHFTLSSFEKYEKNLKFNLNNYSLFTKANYLKAKFNLEYQGAGYPPMTQEMRREYEETVSVLKKMFNNPIELKP